MSIIDLAELDRKVTIENYTYESDVYGGPVETWSETATVWAKIDDFVELKQGVESMRAEKETLIGRKTVIIRYRTDVDEKSRLVIDGANNDIINVTRMDDRGRKRYLKLICTQVD